MSSRTEDISQQVLDELYRARSKFDRFNSAHEGYAVIAEELDELWDLVKEKQKNHDFKQMYAECIQIAAMAIRFAEDVACHNDAAC